MHLLLLRDGVLTILRFGTRVACFRVGSERPRIVVGELCPNVVSLWLVGAITMDGRDVE